MEKKIRNEGRSVLAGIQVPPKPKTYDKNDPFYGDVRIKKNSFVGHVVSAKSANTATVLIDRFVKVKKYNRFLKKSTKIQVHNPTSIEAKEGDVVRVFETRPLSKTKHHVIVEVLGKHVDISGQDLAMEEKEQTKKTVAQEEAADKEE